MKARTFITTVFMFFFWCVTGSGMNGLTGKPENQNLTSEGKTIRLTCSPELYRLAAGLAEEYGKSNPSGKVDVMIQPTGVSDQSQQISMLTEEDLKNGESTLLWKMFLASDAVVPVINAANPMMEIIKREGLTSQDFAALFSGTDSETWESLVTGGSKTNVHFFIPDNAFLRNQLAAFSGIESSLLKGKSLSSANEMLSAVQMDPYAVGFCRMSELTDPQTNAFYADIRVIPIDKNRNGRMDHFENIYTGKEDFIHGVWLGKYPKSLCSGIYAVAAAKPEGKSELAFLEWIISEGQQHLPSAGYSELSGIQQRTALEALAPLVAVTEVQGDTAHSKGWVLALLTLFVAGLMILPVILVRRKKPAFLPVDLPVSAALNEASLAAPAGIFFDKTHTWAFMEKEGLVKLGIDDFIQHITGSLTRIVMKSPGEKIRKGEVAVTIVREGKQLKLYAPVTGIIRKNNRKLETDSTLLNSSPYSEGWIYMIEPRNWLKDIQYMLMGEPYRKWLNEEIGRLKDFFAAAGRKNSLVWSQVVLQDGGEMADHVLADLGPDVWEEFQTEFIDASK